MIAKPAIVRASSLDRDPLKKDFRNFQYKVWNAIFGNSPTDNMYEMGWRLDHGPDRDILMGFRGFAKSYITVTKGVHWLYCDPTEIVLTVSASGDGAKGNADLAWFLIQNLDFLAHMKPSGSLRQSAQAFDVPGSRGEKSESFAALSLFGQITGRRASKCIPDDIETPNTSTTENDRNNLATRYAEIPGAVMKPGGQIKMLGTAQTENTIYLDLALNKGYGMWMMPSHFPRADPDPKKDEMRHYGAWLAPHVLRQLQANPALAGSPTEPSRFTEADLAQRQIDYGVLEFRRQFRLWMQGEAGKEGMLLRDIPVIEIAKPTLEEPRWKVPGAITWLPSPTTAYPNLDVDALNGDSQAFAPITLDLWAEPTKKVLQVDPSGGGTDETAWGVFGGYLGRVFLAHMNARLEGFSASTMKAIAQDAFDYTVHEIVIEKNFGGGMFGELLRPYIQEVRQEAKLRGDPRHKLWEGCEIVEENAGQVAKEVRVVDGLSGVISAHRLVIAAEVLRWDYNVNYPTVAAGKQRNYRLTYQLTRITKVKGCLTHDDRVDMLNSGVARFKGSMMELLKAAEERARTEGIEKAMAGMLENMDEISRRMLQMHSAPSSPLEGLLNRETPSPLLSPYRHQSQ